MDVFTYLPLYLKRSWSLSSCIQLSSDENSSTSVKSSLEVDSSTLPHPVVCNIKRILVRAELLIKF